MSSEFTNYSLYTFSFSCADVVGVISSKPRNSCQIQNEKKEKKYSFGVEK